MLIPKHLQIKSQIVKSVGVPHMFQIDINEYPQLNHTSLENYTQSLEALDFKYLGDLGSRHPFAPIGFWGEAHVHVE